MKQSKEKSPARVCVVETIYHQEHGQQPTVVDWRFEQKCETDEQVYGPRKMKVGDSWTALDCGWNERAGQVHIKNEGPEAVGLSTHTFPDWWILPGKSLRGMPASVKGLKLICPTGEATVKVTVFPA